MKSPITKYIECRFYKMSGGGWYAVRVPGFILGGHRLKRELIEFMEERCNADIIGDCIFVPSKMLDISLWRIEAAKAYDSAALK